MQVIERVTGHYEVEDVQFGAVYKWCPEVLLVECECTKRVAFTRKDLLTDSPTTCECGAALTVDLQEEVLGHRMEDDEALHPWRYWHPKESAGIPA